MWRAYATSFRVPAARLLFLNDRKLSSAYKKYEKRGQLLEEILMGTQKRALMHADVLGAEDAAAEADDVFSVFEPPEGKRWFFFAVFLYGLRGLSVCGSQRDDARTGTDEGRRTDSDGRKENLAGGEKTAVKISGRREDKKQQLLLVEFAKMWGLIGALLSCLFCMILQRM